MPKEPVLARREQILRVAEKLFAEHGYRETDLDQVATTLGIKRQAIYYYFPSKDEILVELIQLAGDALQKATEPVFASDLEPAAKLAQIVQAHAMQVLEHPSVFRIQFAELDKLSGPRAEQLRAARDRYLRALSGVIHDGQSRGQFVDGPATVLALLIVGMCNWTVQWFDADAPVAAAEVAASAARLAVSGLLPS